MSSVERMTITLTSEMAHLVKSALDEGGYASSSEVIREALRDWKIKRELQTERIAALRAEIAQGMADVASGRTVEPNLDRIVQRGKKLSRSRSV